MVPFRMKGALFITLILAIPHFGKGSSLNNVFNCHFDDADYNLRLFSNIYDARFGDEYVDGILTSSFKEYYLNNIEKTYAKFIASGLKYNSIGNYLRFYEEYQSLKDCPSFPGILGFLQKYKEKIRPDEDPVGNIITLMKKLAVESPIISRNSYLVTASSFPGSTYNCTHDGRDTSEPSFWKHEHVAGIIKFGFPVSVNETRIGFVLLDPKYLKKPLVFMDDMGTLPFKHEYSEDAREPSSENSIVFEKLSCPKEGLAHSDRTKSKYIVAKYANAEIVYFFPKAYCTFMEHTVKPSLLLHERRMDKNDETNEEVAVVSIDVHHKEKRGAPSRLRGFFKLKNDSGNWNFLDFPTDKNYDEIAVAMKKISTPVNMICSARYLDMMRRIIPYACLDFWTHRIKQFKLISEDTEFLKEADTTLQLYRTKGYRAGVVASGYTNTDRNEETPTTSSTSKSKIQQMKEARASSKLMKKCKKAGYD